MSSQPSPNRQAVIVGLFVAVGAAILAGGILTIGDLNDSFTRKIAVTAVFEQVNGLQPGDNIWYSGLKVGTVSELAFHGASGVEVELRIDREATQYIHGDVLASISSDGLIGNRIVVLSGGSDDAPPVQEGDVLATSEAVSTEDIMATLQENNANMQVITTDLMALTNGLAMGEGSLGKLLTDDSLYEDAAESVASLSVASRHAESLTASLSSFSAKMNRDGSLPNELVTDQTSYASLTATVERLEHTSVRAADLVDGLASGAADPKTPIGTLMHDEAAGRDLKSTIDNLERSSALLEEDLEALQHNFLLKGYFRRKAKSDAKAELEAAEADAAVLVATP